jgi:hypothetical protein
MANNLIDRLLGRNGHQNGSAYHVARESARPSGVYHEEFTTNDLQRHLLRERISELQLQLEDRGWARIGDSSLESFEFDRAAIKAMCRLSRLNFLKNPIINRGVNVQAIYVWGQGVKVSTRDENIRKIVDRFWNDPGNRAELTGHRARVLKECDIQVDGNIFFALFANPDTGAVSIRTLPVNQVEQIVHNPDDRKDPWFYKRVYQATDLKSQFGRTMTGEKTVFYPDWQLEEDVHFPEGLPQLDNNASFAQAVKIFHMKVGGLSEMQFGIPETYQAIDWARAYKEFLEDWATIVKSLSRFAWKMTTPTGADALGVAQSVMGSTVSVESDETNPAPPAGSMFVESGDFNLQAMPKTGATIQADDGRRLLLMALAALGIPETFTGDVSVGTLATAESLDRPTELKFRDRQTLWQDGLQEILQYVIQRAAASGYLGLELRRVDEESNDSVQESVWKVFKDGKEVDTTVEIHFPPILERDMKKVVESVIEGTTLNGRPELPQPMIPRRETSRLILQALNVSDVDGQLKEMYNDNGTLRTDGIMKPKDDKPEPTPAPDNPPTNPTPPNG